MAKVRVGEQTYELTREGMEWTRRSQPQQVLKKGDVAWFRLEPAEEEGAEPRLMLEQEPVIEGAALVLESATGAVRAMVGGWDFQRSRFNRAVQAERQVGSAFKPFVWGAALEAGYTAADTLFDAPTYFLGADNQPDYKPRNYDREYYGIITLRRALEKSLNMTAVKLQDMIGVEQTIDFAKRCGVSVELPPYASLALGVTEMTPLELAGAYAAIANQGTFVQPFFIERVESRNGLSLDEQQPATRHATSPEVAFVLSSMLEGVVDRGTATALREFPLDLAGKTGTTDDFSDAWFVGFTPRYTLLSWVGYDQRRSLGRGMTGAEAAIPIWKKMIEDGLERGWLEPEERFSPPPGVTTASVEYYSGLLSAPGAERVIQETFVIGTEPAQSWDPTMARIMSLPWYQQRPFYIPKEGERMPEDFADVARQKRAEELSGKS
jgi:penicillin-binding protein 1A